MYFEDVDFCVRALTNNLKLSHVETKASQNPNGPNPYFRSKNSIIFSRRINSKMMSLTLTKRNLLGVSLLFAKFRFADAKQRFLGIIAGWKAKVD
jgi:GT2 family glycosyltransferase